MVELTYRVLLRRAHDEEGVTSHCKDVARLGSIRGVIQNIKASTEYMETLGIAANNSSEHPFDPHTTTAPETSTLRSADPEQEQLKQLSPRARAVYWQLKSDALLEDF
jgi:hypothetical protein